MFETLHTFHKSNSLKLLDAGSQIAKDLSAGKSGGVESRWINNELPPRRVMTADTGSALDANTDAKIFA